LRDSTPLPEAGRAWREPGVLWPRVVGQICAVGSSRSWDALDDLGLWDELSLERVRALGEREDATRAVHSLLARARVRYCSPAAPTSVKAEAVVANAHAPLLSGGGPGLLDALRREVGTPAGAADGVFSHAQACAARRLLVGGLSFFGPKSASDFLLGVGLADSLLAFDVRLLNLLVDHLGWDPAARRRVHALARYEELERDVIARLAEPLGWNGAELDRVLFYHYRALQRAWEAPEKVSTAVDGRSAAGRLTV
jgi:hypothetical protein